MAGVGQKALPDCALVHEGGREMEHHWAAALPTSRWPAENGDWEHGSLGKLPMSRDRAARGEHVFVGGESWPRRRACKGRVKGNLHVVRRDCQVAFAEDNYPLSI